MTAKCFCLAACTGVAGFILGGLHEQSNEKQRAAEFVRGGLHASPPPLAPQPSAAQRERWRLQRELETDRIEAEKQADDEATERAVKASVAKLAAAEAERNKPPDQSPPKDSPEEAAIKRKHALAASDQQAAHDEDKLIADKRERDYRKLIDSAKFRRWISLGGGEASEAKIVAYDGHVVTLERRAGKSAKIEVSRMGKADRDYVDHWFNGN